MLQEPEECDDGLLTGTPASVCQVDCQSGTMRFEVEGSLPLPFSARRMSEVLQANVAGDALVFSNFDHAGIGVLYGSRQAVQTGEIRWLHILPPQRSHPTSFDIHNSLDGKLFVLWTEARIEGTGGPWFFRAHLGADPGIAPTIEELPHPVSDGAGGTFLWRGAVYGTYLVDRDITGLLWAVFLPSSGDKPTPASLGPAPGAIDRAQAWISRNNSPTHTTGIVRFFSEPTSVHVTSMDDSDAIVDIVELWPLDVIHGDDGYFGRAPIPVGELAMLDTAGVISIWPFDDPLPEVASMYFATAPLGTQMIAAVNHGDHDSIIALSPTGELVAFANNGSGDSLAPQKSRIADGCEVCTIGERGGRGTLTDWLALDETVYQVSVSFEAD